MAAAPRESGQQVPQQAVAQRERDHQLGEFGDGELVPAGRRLGLVEPLQDGHPALLQPGGDGRQGPTRQPVQGGPAPQGQGLAQTRGPVRARLRSRVHQGGELLDVDADFGSAEEVARPVGADRRHPSGAAAEEAAQQADHVPDLAVGGGRRGFVPDRVDQPGHRDDPVGMGHQEGQQRLLAATADGEHGGVRGPDLQRPQDPELHSRPSAGSSARPRPSTPVRPPSSAPVRPPSFGHARSATPGPRTQPRVAHRPSGSYTRRPGRVILTRTPGRVHGAPRARDVFVVIRS